MSQMELNEPLTLADLAMPGVRAVRRFWRAFALIQFCGAMLVLTYFQSTAVQHACEALSRLQQRGGLLLSAIAAAIAGGIVPEIAKAIVPPRSPAAEQTGYRLNVGDVAFAIGAFAVNGIVTDLQYRLFNWAIGTDNTFSTALKKMLTDQFITTPIYGAVYWAVIFRWKTHQFRIVPLLREVGPRWYAIYVGRLLVPSWCFWVPMVLMVYLMPRTLQFSLFCLVLAAWSLLMVFVASEPAG